MNQLKSKNNSDISDAIVVSFAHKSAQQLGKEEINYVFRKRGPTLFEPKWIYVYAGSPTSALVGRFPVLSTVKMTIPDCLALANFGAIEKSELKNYAANYSELFVFMVCKYEPFLKPYTRQRLLLEFGFTPPQSFTVLSTEGKKVVDCRCLKD